MLFPFSVLDTESETYLCDYALHGRNTGVKPHAQISVSKLLPHSYLRRNSTDVWEFLR